MTKRLPLQCGRTLVAACTLLAAPLAAQAQTDEILVAGWDFSQYAVAGFLSLDGQTLTGNILDANHSDLDPTAGSGIESNQYGRMYLNGSFGSTPAILDPNFQVPDPFQPVDAPPSGSLVSNVDQAFLAYGSPSACTQQQIENMPFANCSNLAMIALDAVSVVFAANRTGVEGATGSWSVSFAGRTITAGTASATVQFSTDGSSYGNVGTANFTETDSEFSYFLGEPTADQAYVRLVFPTPPALEASPVVDNLGIALTVPEAASAPTAALLGLYLARRFFSGSSGRKRTA